MGLHDQRFGFIPADAGIGDGNEGIKILLAGFAVDEVLLAFLYIAFQHHSANGVVWFDAHAIGVTDSLNQYMIENFALFAIIFATVLMAAIH